MDSKRLMGKLRKAPFSVQMALRQGCYDYMVVKHLFYGIVKKLNRRTMGRVTMGMN